MMREEKILEKYKEYRAMGLTEQQAIIKTFNILSGLDQV